MNALTMTNDQILELGCKALVDKLGPIGMIRFIHQFEAGTGNYTEDRHQWLEVSDVETLANQIQQEEDSAEYIVKVLGSDVEQKTDYADAYVLSDKVWLDEVKRDTPIVDLETEDIGENSISHFQIDNQKQKLAATG